MVLRKLLVSIETTKVVAISSTRGPTSSRSENENNEKMETLSLQVHFASCKHWLFQSSVGHTLGQAGFGLAC